MGAPELARMEKLGVIRKVDKPTNWCAGMVTVPKSNGNIRIGVDLTKLNEIQLKPDAQPFAIMTPGRIPLPIKSTVKEELARM